MPDPTETTVQPVAAPNTDPPVAQPQPGVTAPPNTDPPPIAPEVQAQLEELAAIKRSFGVQTPEHLESLRTHGPVVMAEALEQKRQQKQQAEARQLADAKVQRRKEIIAKLEAHAKQRIAAGEPQYGTLDAVIDLMDLQEQAHEQEVHALRSETRAAIQREAFENNPENKPVFENAEAKRAFLAFVTSPDPNVRLDPHEAVKQVKKLYGLEKQPQQRRQDGVFYEGTPASPGPVQGDATEKHLEKALASLRAKPPGERGTKAFEWENFIAQAK